MKLRQLEAHLQEVQGFQEPKVALEQYVTPAHIAAHLLHAAHVQYGDVERKTVADLGCGCGVLALGAAMLGAAAVTGFDIDGAALAVCQENLSEFELPCIELVQTDVLQLLTDAGTRWRNHFDTVILNPPFGTKNNQGTDLKFLEVAGALTQGAVYSLHKSSTRKHVIRKASTLGLAGEVVAELRYDLPKTYAFHKKTSVDVQVDFIRFTHKNS
ncbi:hypothetical protein HAZT_HAZT011906 [Hyalella azteca]|uniref:Methyltransferase-like protein 5 n=1 Tax=Hyalella azteca TaxID=294128 RepID=A0A6A0GYV3_HYAAZ|nr:rRNA N6-adenosine-methyltransferase METTL5-like [Hyalella azteca]KAA0193277.1 hypothetical protein HAZT_HAZT011906 [Hyalella azteca]